MANTPGSVNALIDSASRRGNIPNNQMTYIMSDFLAMAQEELFAYALPVLHARRDDYYLDELMFDLSTPDLYIGNQPPSSVLNPAWRLPAWAMASTVRDVQAVSAGGSFYNLGRISVDDVPNMIAQGWYFYGDYLVFRMSNIGSTAPPIAIRCVVHSKPNQLMISDQLLNTYKSQVSFDQGQEFTVTGVLGPTQYNVSNYVGYSTITYDNKVDVTSGKPGYEVTNRGLQILTVSYPLLELVDPPSKPINVGDRITIEGYTTMVPLPLEMQPLLAQRIVVKFLEAQGDQGQIEQARMSLDEMVRQVPLLIQPRAEGKPKKIAPRLGLWRRWRW